MTTKKPTTAKPTDYETRVQAMKLAIAHSKFSHTETLIKLAERIHGFITGTGPKSKAGDYI
jgi:hypothetical protein